MCDFDLSQALDRPLDLEVTGFESRCFNMGDVQDEIIRIDDGLELVVSHNTKTMKDVANLVLAVNRMKKPLTHCTQELSDEELCIAIMDSVVEETVVKTVVNCTGRTNRCFYRTNSEKECALCDSEQKAVICPSGDLTLQAITLKGGYNDRKVNFKLSKYITAIKGDGETVVLSVKTTNMHISCSMNSGKAVLKLEECSEETLKNITDNNMERFLFCKRTRGISMTTFESVSCPDWFISTCSDKDEQPVEMCKENTAYRVTNFRMI